MSLRPRPLAPLLLLASVASGCGAPRRDVKAPGNLPVRTAEELAAEDAARTACLEACATELSGGPACEQACLEAHPIVQVELIGPPPR